MADRAPLLQEYLGRYERGVQGYFRVKAGSELEAFAGIAEHHPVFELVEVS